MGLLVFVGTPVIVGLAWLFFLVCEKPFIKMNQRVRKQVALEVVTDPAP
jgi:peptidoglycan/LPS O-acetylase OafA/YrhL